jgi:hypothetical protein
MSCQSNIIRGLLKVIGFTAFILLITGAVFCNDRINTGRQGAAIRVEQPTASSDQRAQTTDRDLPSSGSAKSSFISAESEPLLLFFFGLLLFSVATGIRLKLLER